VALTYRVSSLTHAHIARPSLRTHSSRAIGLPMATLDRILSDLTQEPRRLPLTADAAPGIYSWWVPPERLGDADPRIPEVSAGAAGWSLLYCGIAPNSTTSRRLLSKRVGRDHSRGSIGNSTFRQSLAALLRDTLRLEPLAGYDRSRVRDEGALTAWLTTHCGLTWAVQPAPWDWEVRVIGALLPPLSISPGAHPFRFQVSEARSRLRADCGL
jgi:hypothetical protein